MQITIHTITENEAYIISALRSLKPFEQVIIMADRLGKPDHYIVVQSTKVVLTNEEPVPLKQDTKQKTTH